MKSKISALMDGELGNQDALSIIEVLRRDDELRMQWQTFHLIGDTLRQSSKLSTDVSHRVSQQLTTEPTVLSPRTSLILKPQKYKVFAASIAASIVVVFSAWLMMYTPSYMTQPTMLVENSNQSSNNLPATALPLMVSSPAVLPNYPSIEMNEYLFVHREFSPGINMRGQMIHINNINEYNERYGR